MRTILPFFLIVGLLLPAAVDSVRADDTISKDPRLTQLDESFQARLRADADEPYEAALAALNRSYLKNGIARARTAARKKGALEVVIALDTEKTRMETGQGLPPADLETLPASLLKLRATYRAAHDKLLAERDAKAAPLYDIYLEALDAYVVELTRAGDIERAKEVKGLQKTIVARKPVTQIPVASLPGSGPSPQAEPRDTGGRNPSQNLARWAVSVGASIRVKKRDEIITISTEKDIPRGRFDVISFNFQGNAKAGSITDDDFTRFSGQKELTEFSLGNIEVGDRAFRFLATTPALSSFHLHRIPVTDEVFSHLAGLERLSSLGFYGTRSLTGKGLGQLASLPVLREIHLAQTGFNTDGLKILAGAPKLEVLNLESTAVTAEGVAALGGLTALRRIDLRACAKLDGSFLKSWPVMPTLRELNLSKLRFAGEDYSALARQTGLTSLNLAEQPIFDDAALSRLAPLVRMKDFDAGGTVITGTGFRALTGWTAMENLSLSNAPITAEGMAALASAFPALNDLNFGDSLKVEPPGFHHLASMKTLRRLTVHRAVNDAALAEIARIPGLGGLNIENSPVSHEGLAALKEAKALTNLNLGRCKGLDDRAVPHLKKLRFLRELYLSGTGLSEDSVAELKKAMSTCEIK